MIKILFAAFIATIFIGFIAVPEIKDHSDFQQFKNKYLKSYHPYQQFYREQIFLKNKDAIESHNLVDNKQYTLQINQFADLTIQQFKASYLGLIVSNSNQRAQNIQDNVRVEYQQEIDWQKQGKVTRVKNQKMCASCWAFCSIASLQSAYRINKGLNLQFSEQQLVDCSTPYGNLGCHGGQLQYAFLYMQQKGVNTEEVYPYTGKDQNCKKTSGPYKMAGYKRELTCGGLYSALQKGPVAVAVDALFWAYYKEGVYDNCGNEVNHGVLVVGATADYWWVKNSWGAQWGDNGYIKIKRGNTCSICEYPYHPIL